jgi:prefoldin subunit 5
MCNHEGVYVMKMSETTKQELKFLQSLLELIQMKGSTDRTETCLSKFKQSAEDLVTTGQISKASYDLFLHDCELTNEIQELKDKKKKMQEQLKSLDKQINTLEEQKETISEAKNPSIKKEKPQQLSDPCSLGGGIIRSSC